jgi:hypothetical protein
METNACGRKRHINSNRMPGLSLLSGHVLLAREKSEGKEALGY